MIHIISASNRHLYRAQLQQMHQLRRVHFVEERGWKDLTVIDGGEYDQYDDDRTVYFLSLDENAQVIAGMRGRPTDDKSMIGDVFPDLIGPDHFSLSAPNIWEISRTFATRVARKQTKATGRSFMIDILLACMEWLEPVGVERLIGIVDLPFFHVCRSWGWNCLMTGLPLDTPDGPIIGLQAGNSAADVEALRRIQSRPIRVGHHVTDEDVAAFGGLERIEAEFEILRADAREESIETRSADRSA